MDMHAHGMRTCVHRLTSPSRLPEEGVHGHACTHMHMCMCMRTYVHRLTSTSRLPEEGERHETVFLQPLTASMKSSAICACRSTVCVCVCMCTHTYMHRHVCGYLPVVAFANMLYMHRHAEAGAGGARVHRTVHVRVYVHAQCGVHAQVHAVHAPTSAAHTTRPPARVHVCT